MLEATSLTVDDYNRMKPTIDYSLECFGALKFSKNEIATKCANFALGDFRTMCRLIKTEQQIAVTTQKQQQQIQARELDFVDKRMKESAKLTAGETAIGYQAVWTLTQTKETRILRISVAALIALFRGYHHYYYGQEAEKEQNFNDQCALRIALIEKLGSDMRNVVHKLGAARMSNALGDMERSNEQVKTKVSSLEQEVAIMRRFFENSNFRLVAQGNQPLMIEQPERLALPANQLEAGPSNEEGVSTDEDAPGPSNNSEYSSLIAAGHLAASQAPSEDFEYVESEPSELGLPVSQGVPAPSSSGDGRSNALLELLEVNQGLD